MLVYISCTIKPLTLYFVSYPDEDKMSTRRTIFMTTFVFIKCKSPHHCQSLDSFGASILTYSSAGQDPRVNAQAFLLITILIKFEETNISSSF